MKILTKLKNKIILSIVKSQSKKIATLAVAGLENLNEKALADKVTAIAEAFIKNQIGYTVPDSIDAKADEEVAKIIDGIRDYAVELCKKENISALFVLLNMTEKT